MLKERPQGPKLALILALSLLAHALLLLLPVTQSPLSSQSEPGRISLVAPPSSRALPDSETEPDAATQPESATTSPEAPATESAEPVSSSDATPPEPAERTSANPDELRRQALRLAGQANGEDDGDARTSTLSFAPAPRLPGATGWMDTHVGKVTAGREHWQAADGGLHSRIVAANGQVVCTSIRPPTVQEFFNPSMSAAVAMMRECGRERPQASRTRDPWQRNGTD